MQDAQNTRGHYAAQNTSRKALRLGLGDGICPAQWQGRELSGIHRQRRDRPGLSVRTDAAQARPERPPQTTEHVAEGCKDAHQAFGRPTVST